MLCCYHISVDDAVIRKQLDFYLDTLGHITDIRNSIGLNTDPSGTADVTGAESELSPSTTTI